MCTLTRARARAQKTDTQTPTMLLPRHATCSNINGCNLACLEPDAFNFTGSRDVTTLDIGGNLFTELPEELLWSTPALVEFSAKALKKLETLPERFFQGPEGQHALEKISVTASNNFGSQQRLPEQLFAGLGKVKILDVSDCGIQVMPSLDSLTVRGTHSCSGL